MSLIKRMRKQDAVWWAVTGQNSAGEDVYALPTQIKCRWEDVAEEFTNTAGQVSISNSRVYVDRVMNEGDMLWLGTLNQLTSQTVPTDNLDAFPIRKFSKIPNLRNTETLLEAKL